MTTSLLTAVVQLFYPHCCESCGTDLLQKEELLCLRCAEALPVTHFQRYQHNPVEKIFWGRVPVDHAMAAYYYSQSSCLQAMIHRFKYQQRKDIALYLGRKAGHLLQQSAWLHKITGIVPVPLFPHKLRQRGYNQSQLLAEGIAAVTGLPVLPALLQRQRYTGTQTRKDRSSRWQNVSGGFTATDGLAGHHLLLVDDVITTGATTEACCQALVNQAAKVSVCALAFTYN